MAPPPASLHARTSYTSCVSPTQVSESFCPFTSATGANGSPALHDSKGKSQIVKPAAWILGPAFGSR